MGSDLGRFVVMALLLSRVAPGQSPPPRFEVAVIRPTPPGTSEGTKFEVFEGGRVKITNEPVKLLVRAAFQLQNAQIAGGPGWLETDRYDIEAKTGRPEKLKQEQLAPLMQSLLAERFNLKFHREPRELAVYALVVGKGGPKFKAKSEGEGSGMNTKGGPGKSQLAGTGVSMELLAGYVGNRLGRIVVDKTGLSDSYDFKLEWAPDEAADSSSPSLVTALQEQLGLRLESRKSPVEVLVIDSMDRPSEN
jgi:uncharacterized protein (TIGR03435 family)